jgi:hypothetical protein
MRTGKVRTPLLLLLPICLAALSAHAQSFRVQCPPSTITHPAADNNSEPAYNGPTVFSTNAQGYVTPTSNVNGAIKCQQISGGDGYSTMADGTQTFMFSFGPLSGLADIAAGLPGTEFPNIFNTVFPYATPPQPGDPATTDGASDTGSGTGGYAAGTLGAFAWNGAVGLTGDQSVLVPGGGTGAAAAATISGGIVTDVAVTNGGSGYTSPPSVTFSPPTTPGGVAALGNTVVSSGQVTFVNVTFTGSGYTTAPAITFGPGANACTGANPPAQCLTGHVDPRPIMDVGVMNGNIPAPLIAFDEDDEFFLTLTNVGMIMRPDLFEQHTVHFHGYPNASSFYDGVPDASVAINIGGSFTYYYMAPDAGTYFWHCHITPPEHLQMGMVGQLYVRPRQDRVPQGQSLYTYLGYQNGIGLPAGTAADPRTACNPANDILCSATMPATPNATLQSTDKLGNPQRYTYNDGDGSTAYDVEYPIQMHGFDPNFHFVGMTFNPEMFVDMKDKYFLLNGRSYPDTIGATGGQPLPISAPGPQATQSSDGAMHYSQPLPAIINIPAGGKALLRLMNLSVSEYHTLQTLGVPMKVVGFNAKLLRDQGGNNTEYYTNSITLGGGESLDAILDASDAGCGSTGCAAQLYPAGSTFYLYTPNLDHLSNDAENFGGLMTEVHICNSVSSSTFGNTCN